MSSSNGARSRDSLVDVLANQLSTDRLAEDLQNTVLRPHPERASNSVLFQRFLELLTSQCSSGSRFHCLAPESCCAPCSLLHRHIQTYVDVATLDEIQSIRKQSGLCSYVYCNKRLTGRSQGASVNSTYKIDLSEQRVFRRDVYESFCSAVCIDKNESVQATASNSPMETGVITPRAVRNSNPRSLHALVSGMRRLAPCEHLVPVVNSPRVPVPPSLYNSREPEMLNDKCVMFNYKSISEVRRVRFATPISSTESTSPRSSAELSVPSQNAAPTPSPPTSPSSSPSSVQNRLYPSVDQDISMAAQEDTAFDYNDLYDPNEAMRPRVPLLKCLNLFSILWYTLSTCLTYKTREFFRTGNASDCTLDDKTRQWYTALLRHIPEVLVPTVSGALESLLSTFRIGNNTPALENDHFRVLSHVLLYVLLRNGDRVLSPGSGHISYEDLLRQVEDFLVNSCMLDLDSISILNELLTECE
ncbi:acyl- synthase, putative [Babesia ovis]|uniref:Acyl- synthase, putative n=1 Tax=Babesia ovis TaxID=5869 RepID=A0A9W5TBC4_BABOV|nr:acyl- synthase, putative [Babesia ovis]